jgi:hypothetical protein
MPSHAIPRHETPALPLESHQPLAAQEAGPSERHEAEVTGVAQLAGVVDTISPHS